MKNFILFSCLFLFCSSLQASVKGIDGAEERLIFSDDCKKLCKYSPRPSATAYLLKSGVSRKAFSEVSIPALWLLNWRTFVSESFAGGSNSFLVSAPAEKPLELYGPLVLPDDSRYYAIEVVVGMPAGSKYKSARIDIGILKLGYYEPPKKLGVYAELIPGEEKIVKTTVDLSDDFCDFRPLLRISGELEIRKLRVVKKYDNLAASGLTVVEGTLKECSQIPDPRKSDYPDCRFVCRFVGNSIIAGKPVPKEIAVVLEGFEKYKYKRTRELKAGDKVRMLVAPFQHLPDKKKTTQQADDLNLYMLDNYYVFGLCKVRNFFDGGMVPVSGILFSSQDEKYVSVFERSLNPPMAENFQTVRDAAVRNDLRMLDELLKPYDNEKIAQLNSEFKAAWTEEYQKDAPGRNRVGGLVWRNKNNSFWTLPRWHTLLKKPKLIRQQNIDALIAFKEFLAANGVHFIVVPTPDMFDIAARVINERYKDVPDIQNAAVVRTLLQNDIEAVYSSHAIVKNYNRYPMAFFYPFNGHPSDTTQDVISDLLAEKLRRYEIKASLEPEKFSVELAPHAYGSDEYYWFPANCDIGSNEPGSSYKCRRVLYAGKDVPADKRSPIFMFGSSFMQTPMAYPDSLPTLLSMKLCTGIAALRMNSSGPMTQIMPAVFYDPEYHISGRKVMIMVVSASALTNDNLCIPNLRLMDKNSMLLTGKTLIHQYRADKEYGRVSSGNTAKITVGKSGKELLINDNSVSWSLNKEAVVVIPASHIDLRNKACFKINGAVQLIPTVHNHSSVPYLVTHKIPAGTRSLTVELESAPGVTVAVSNIQIYQ